MASYDYTFWLISALAIPMPEILSPKMLSPLQPKRRLPNEPIFEADLYRIYDLLLRVRLRTRALVADFQTATMSEIWRNSKP